MARHFVAGIAMDRRRAPAYPRIVPGRTSCCPLSPPIRQQEKPWRRNARASFLPNTHQGKSSIGGQFHRFGATAADTATATRATSLLRTSRLQRSAFPWRSFRTAARDAKPWHGICGRMSIRSIRYPPSTVPCQIAQAYAAPTPHRPRGPKAIGAGGARSKGLPAPTRSRVPQARCRVRRRPS